MTPKAGKVSKRLKEKEMIRTLWTSRGEQLNFETPIQLDMVGGWVVCDVCANILPHTDGIPYCDYLCNLKVIKKKNRATSKKR